MEGMDDSPRESRRAALFLLISFLVSFPFFPSWSFRLAQARISVLYFVVANLTDGGFDSTRLDST